METFEKILFLGRKKILIIRNMQFDQSSPVQHNPEIKKIWNNKKKKNPILLSNIRRMRFEQSSPLQPASDFSVSSTSVT